MRYFVSYRFTDLEGRYGFWNTVVNTTRKISSVEDVRNIERAIEDSNIFIEQAWLMNYVPIEEDIPDCTDEMKKYAQDAGIMYEDLVNKVVATMPGLKRDTTLSDEDNAKKYWHEYKCLMQ